MVGTFERVSPSPQQSAVLELVREGFAQMEGIIKDVVPPGRYQSLALTKLEECAFFATKGITHTPDAVPAKQ